MAEIRMESGLVAENARVVDDPRDRQVAAIEEKKKDSMEELTNWVVSRVRSWRDHRRSNYEQQWDQYERLWRSMWAPEDKSKPSERSTLVTPALAEAVENIVAEVEEAIFGRGDFFDLKGEDQDDEKQKEITDKNKINLKEDLARCDFVPNISEALMNGAVYGTGIGEIIVESYKMREISAAVQEIMPPMGQMGPMGAQDPMMAQMMGAMDPAMGAMDPAMGAMDPMAGQMPPADPMMDPAMAPMAPPMPEAPLQGPTMAPEMAPAPTALQVTVKEVHIGSLQSVNPRNFVIDPNARTIDKALGCAVEEYVGAHIINEGQRQGSYREGEINTAGGDQELTPDRQNENEYVGDKVHIIRYYGLVPKHLLFPPGETENLFPTSAGEELGQMVREAEAVAEEVMADLSDESEDGEKSVEPIDGEMVEAIVFIANESFCLKAQENPYIMQDRPVVAFPWDIVPGRFWGRGVCEKGHVPQRVMDAELRARIDALAYVSAPMMAMDASRLPRGFKLVVKPGRSILTNGDPKTILNPMTFGQLEQSTFNHSQQLDQMIQRATGSLDVIALAQRGGDARPGAVSMMLSGIVKRHKRTLMGFVDRFFVPALRKIMWRNMQFYPERYEPVNWSFNASSTMGILQREYETQNLVQLMNTMEPQSPEYKALLKGVIANTGLAHRQQIIQLLDQSIQQAAQAQQAQLSQAANPQLMQMQQQMQQLEMQLRIAETQAKIEELKARAALQMAKAQNEMLEPQFREVELATKGLYAVQQDQQQAEFDRRMAAVDREIAWEDIKSNERIAQIQSGASVKSEGMKSAAALASEKVRASAQRAAAQKEAAAQQPKPMPVPVPVPVPAPTGPKPFIARRPRVM